MSFEIVEKNKVLREVIITVPGSDVKAVEGRMVSQACKTVKMNGFRKGKVPAAVIRARAGESIMEDARRECLQTTARDILKSIDKLLYVGEVDIVTPKTEDGGFVAKLEAEVEPVVDSVDYKGIEVTVADVNVTDDDVAKAIEDKRQANATLEPVTDRKVVEDGDVVEVELSAPNDAASNICSAGNRQIHVGKGDFNDEMEKCLVGATIDDPVQLTAKHDDGDAIVTAVVKEIKKSILPALDDDFARDTGDAETLDGLRDATRKKLVEAAESERDEKIKDALLSALRDRVKFDIPENYVKDRAAQATRMQLEMMFRQRLSDDIVARIRDNIKEEELVEYRDSYCDEIILNAIAAAENYEVSDDDVKAEARKLLSGATDDKLDKWLKNSEARDLVVNQVKRDRALDAVKAAAVIKAA